MPLKNPSNNPKARSAINIEMKFENFIERDVNYIFKGVK